jgi:hypothetical protein
MQGDFPPLRARKNTDTTTRAKNITHTQQFGPYQIQVGLMCIQKPTKKQNDSRKRTKVM